MPDAGQIMTVEVDTTRLNDALAALQDALIGQGQDATNILKQEHKALTRTIVNFTPPLPKQGARRIGENAVRRDLTSLISEASPQLIDELGSQYGLQNVDAYRMNKQGERTHFLWDRIVLNPVDLPALHNSYRNARGRIPRLPRTGKGVWNSRIVVEYGKRDPYIEQVKSHVGRWKAKWAFGAAQLGDRYPNWISRHFSHVGANAFFQANLENRTAPFITFGGRGPNFASTIHAIKGAVKFRTQTIMRRVSLVVSGYAKDISAGIRARAQAHKQNVELEEVE